MTLPLASRHAFNAGWLSSCSTHGPCDVSPSDPTAGAVRPPVPVVPMAGRFGSCANADAPKPRPSTVAAATTSTRSFFDIS